MLIRTFRAWPPLALAFIPLLTVPALLGAFAAVFVPGSPGGAVVLVISTVALAWYMLGGVFALQMLVDGLRDRHHLQMLKPALESAEIGALAVNADGLILRQSPRSRELLGDLIGRRVQDCIARLQADVDGFWTRILGQVARGQALEIEVEGAGAFSITCRAGGTIQLWRMTSCDAVEPGEGDDGQVGFDNLPVALLLLDAHSQVVRANAAACDILGETLEGLHLATLLEGPGRALGDWIADTAAGRQNGTSEVLRVKGDGPEHFVQMTLKRGADKSVMAILSDANALKRLEAQFVQSQKMQAIGQLAGGIAHDFNNLLTAISGHCDLLMLRHDKGDPDYADLEQINQNANRAAALVGQLLAYSRKQTLKLKYLDLRDSLSDLTHLLNRLVGERIVLTFHHDPKLHMIRADKRQLEQVIMNLVVNARDAMPDGGDIVITTRNVTITDKRGGETFMLPLGDYVEVTVEDHGSGIAPEVLDKMFEPFFSTKRTGEGTGLGLSTAYGIVKQTGGYIFCDSVLGEGTRFSLYFPAHVGELESKPEIQEADLQKTIPPQALHEPTVLLVEDEAPVRAFASRALQLQGCKVLEASCAEDALALLTDQRLAVDIFVTDVVMPGLDGPSWVRTALRDRPGTRVIFMSGYTEDIFAEGSAPVPDAVFLAKPFSLSELTSLVTRQLQEGARKTREIHEKGDQLTDA